MQNILHHLIIPVGRFYKQLCLMFGIYPLFKSFELFGTLSRLYRQISVKGKALSVKSRSHHRKNDRRRAHQRDYLQVLTLRNSHDIGSRIGNGRTTVYIGSMTLGYVGLRYIELSISSPICNASGALVAIIAIVSGTAGKMAIAQYIAIFLACAGVIGLGFVEANEDDDLRAARQEASNYKYAKSWLALALPIAYCILDAAGTFADDLVLETLNEDSANVAYELTFLVAGLIAGAYVLFIKREKLTVRSEGPKYLGAVCETIGQFFYIYALADKAHVAMSAPIIASYCAVSVLWSRLFLKEKLSWKHYAAIAITVAGIAIIGLLDP